MVCLRLSVCGDQSRLWMLAEIEFFLLVPETQPYGKRKEEWPFVVK